MKDNEKILGDVMMELGELEKLEVSDVPEEVFISLGANFMTIFCCG